MEIPVKPVVPPAPSALNPVEYPSRHDAWAAAISPIVDYMDNATLAVQSGVAAVAATANTGDLPSLTGRVGNLLQVVSIGEVEAVGFQVVGAAGYAMIEAANAAAQRTLLSLGLDADGVLNAAARGVVRDAAASATGAAVSKTGIPAWANWIEISLQGVSINAAANVSLRAMVGGVAVSTGYNTQEALILTDTAGTTPFTDRFSVNMRASASTVLSGVIKLSRHGAGNVWVASGATSADGAAVFQPYAGIVSLAGALNGVTLLANSGAFDAGTIAFSYGV